MLPQEQRSIDRTSYYTMKTPSRSQTTPSSSQNHSRSNSQSFFTNKSSSPVGSPRMPHSVGQAHPPRLSPGVKSVAAQDARTPSPNYFGLTVEPTADPRDSPAVPRDNWSPSSSVKSFGAAIPKQMPLDANPEFEAFKRQIDLNKGKVGFSLSSSHFGGVAGPTASTPSALQRPRPPRWQTHDSGASELSLSRAAGVTRVGSRFPDASGRMDTDTDSIHDSAYVSGDSKRNSEASLNPPSFFGIGRYESPAQSESLFPTPDQRKPNFARVVDPSPRLSMTATDRLDQPTPGLIMKPRSDTVPPKLETGGPSMMPSSELKELLETSKPDEILLLDLRVSPQYAESRISGALNFCVPTTLLKRPTFNLQKLQQTFQSEQDRDKFAAWTQATHLVVYDAASSERRDATSGMNMLKKFTNEGYAGSISILRGGFRTFAAAYPQFVDRTSGRSAAGLTLSGASSRPGGGLSIAPVLGGVVLPNASKTSNPFFDNIRQNQDLVDGVGQIDIKLPSNIDQEILPRWLRVAADSSDHGKKVSDKFLHIELAEQARMREAYSSFNLSGMENGNGAEPVQLCGVEKGGKNRYKDILPFEHARVRLQGREEGACDYVNASHIRASRSYKRYIASQGPLPATFDDFWSMIWDQDVRVIVMLTAESEGGQLKCHSYWKGNDFGSIRLRNLSEKKVSLDIDKYRSNSDDTPGQLSNPPTSGSSMGSATTVKQDSFSWNLASPEVGRRRANTVTTAENNAPAPARPQPNSGGSPHVIIRKFALSHAAHPFAPIREITHLHYSSWPDFGAPAQPSHLLALVELANVMQRAASPVDAPGPNSSRNAERSGSIGPEDRKTSSASTPGKSDGVSLGWYDAPAPAGDSRPMLVHCSAGCGRTGTFCTVDSVIDMLKRQKLEAVREASRIIDARERNIAQQMNAASSEHISMAHTDADGDVSMDQGIDTISPLGTFNASSSSQFETRADSSLRRSGSPPVGDSNPAGNQNPALNLSWLGDENVDLIAQTVEDLRTQRLSMVQSLRQFVLCYETITEWVWRLQEQGSAHGLSSRAGRSRSGSLAL